MKSSPWIVFLLLGATAHAQPAPDDPAAPPAPPAPAPAPPPPAPPPEPPPPAPPPPAAGLDAAAVQKLIDASLAARPRTANWDWNDGFLVKSPDGRYKMQLNGYTQFDGRFFVDDKTDPHVDQFGFRTVRPELKGTVFGNYDFRVLTDFGGGKVQLQDAYVDVHYRDDIEIRFGKTKVPFGLERLQRDIYTTFVERGLPSLLTPNRVPGIELFGVVGDGVLEYQAGVFDNAPDNQNADGDASDHKQWVARMFVRPFAHGNALLQNLGIGGAGTYGWEQGTVASPLVPTYVTQGQTTFFGYKAGNTSLADTAVASGRHWRATAQGYYYAGPVGVLGEYVRSQQHVGINGSNDLAEFDAWQGLAQWVITGEKASYNGVTPTHPFGAVDIAARYGELRLADSTLYQTGFADPTKAVHRARSFGTGVDWYPNRAIRFVLDVEHTWYWLGAAMGGNKPSETSLVGRAQTVF